MIAWHTLHGMDGNDHAVWDLPGLGVIGVFMMGGTWVANAA
jgi:hypothetical protein